MTLALLVLLALGPDGPESLRQRGGALLAEGDTLGAVASWEAAVSGPWTNPDVLLTLGERHLARREVGEAVFALERAARLAPLDPEIERARREAYALAGQVAPSSPPPFVAARTVVSRTGAGALVLVALVLYLGAFVLGLVWWRSRRRLVGWTAVAVAPVALGVLVLAGLALWDADRGWSVVLATAELRERPSPEAEAVGVVREGEVVVTEDAAAGWRRVDVGEAEGWVPERAVARL